MGSTKELNVELKLREIDEQWADKVFFFGGYKSRTEVPQLVDEHMSGALPLEQYVTHRFKGVHAISDAIEKMHGGEVLRAVVSY